jgi:hypothetical protein
MFNDFDNNKAVLDKDTLQKMAKNKKLFPVEIWDIKSNNTILLKMDSIEEFINFADELEVKYLFYSYIYYSAENFIIPEDKFLDYPSEMQEEIKQRNVKIEDIDFDRPFSLTLIVSKERMNYLLDFWDDWLEDFGIGNPETDLDSLKEKYQTQISEIIKKREENTERKLENLRELILKDPKFKDCTNFGLRKEYLSSILKKEDMNEYPVILLDKGKLSEKAINFINNTWKIYKKNR